MPGKLDGKVALVVGATSGMGRAAALLFAREGARVAVSGRRAGHLQDLGEQIAAETGQTALGIPCDVQDRAQVDSMLRLTRAQFGRLDVLVFATGTNIPDRSLERLTPETWEMMVATNLTGAFHCTQLALPGMREQGGGLIIYLSSIAKQGPDVSGVAYKASKAGLDGLSGGVNAEEKAHGIRSTLIYPGLCDTELVLKRPVQPTAEVLQQALQPEDVAEACLFVAALPERCHVPELWLVPSRL